MDWPSLIAGGTTSGLVVVLGLVLAAVVERRRYARRNAEAIVLELNNLVSQVVAGFVSDDMDRGTDSTWWELRQRAWMLLGNLRVQARGFRNAKKLRAETETYVAKFAAADSLVVMHGITLPPAVALELTSTGMKEALFGKSRMLAEEFEYYEERWRQYPRLGES